LFLLLEGEKCFLRFTQKGTQRQKTIRLNPIRLDIIRASDIIRFMSERKWSTKGLIPGRIPMSEEFSLDYFSGSAGDGITYPKERQYLNPDSEYRYKFIDLLAQVSRYLDGGRLLDVAAGPGHFSTWSKRKNASFEVVNLDISHEILSWAETTHGIPQPIVGDLNNLPFSEGSFDGVLLFDMLEHVWPSQAEECVENSYKLLKPNGYTFIMIPNRITWDPKPKQYESHIWLPSIREMKSLLLQTGFQSNSIKYYTRGFPISNRWRQLTGSDLKLPYLGRSIFISAQKIQP